MKKFLEKSLIVITILIGLLSLALAGFGFYALSSKYFLVLAGLIFIANILFLFFKSETKEYLFINMIGILMLVVDIVIYKFLPNGHMILPASSVVYTIISLLTGFKKLDSFVDLFIKGRYVIAAIVFALCVTFQIHGSSLNCYNTELRDQEVLDNTYFGTARILRGDEFNVQLPYYFSQEYNDYDKTSYQMSVAGEDMILTYNAPVIDLTLIGKPFHWGYILLGNAYGLSWYWCSKIILCLLVMYELCTILTKGNKKLSLLGSFLIVFSPAMQWWFSPHMYDVFFWASTLFVVGYSFFTSKGIVRKTASTILAGCSLTGFVVAMFPSLQVGLGLVALFTLIACLIRDWQEWSFKKVDFFRMICAATIALIPLGYFVYTSFDQIQLLFNTVYPGARVCVGGDKSLHDLFMNLTNIITPFKSSNVLNDCEVSNFLHLGLFSAAAFLYYAIKNFRKEKGAHIVGFCLFVLMVIEILFMIIGFPEWLAKITLFSYINRMELVYGFTCVLFTIWIFNYIWIHHTKVDCVVLFLLACGYAGLHYSVLNQTDFEYMSVYFYLALLTVAVLMVLFTCIKGEKIVYGGVALLTVLCGCTINPISTGIEAVTDHEMNPVIESIRKENPDAYWMTTDASLMDSFLLANGVKVLNAVNYYPDYGKWEALDPEGTYDDYYNRYAHINVYLTEEKTSYENSSPDVVDVYLNINDLDKWKPTYLLTIKDETKILEKNKKISYKEIYKDLKSNIQILEIVYK